MRILAYLVHLFTASGLLAGFMGLLAAVDGDYRASMLWMLATLVIDGVDGTFARMVKVKEVLPRVDGKTIDYVIDFFTYAILPAYLLYVAIDLPQWSLLLCCFSMLLSAAIYYGLEGMVTADGKHFVGFPVLWNMVVFVLIFVLPDLPDWLLITSIVALAVLHFVPILVPYPSRGGRWWVLTLIAVSVFIGSAVACVWWYPEVPAWARWANLGSIAYLVLVTILDTLAEWARPQVQSEG